MKVRIGINPITWTNDDVPELGGDTPLEVCLSETKQAGYAGTELGGKFPRQSSELRPIMAHYGLAVISGWYDGRCDEKEVEAEMDAITPHLQLLKDMGSKYVVYADTSRGRHGAIWGPISQRPSSPLTNGPSMAASSRSWPRGWRISACAWPSIITWEPLSRPMKKWA